MIWYEKKIVDFYPKNSLLFQDWHMLQTDGFHQRHLEEFYNVHWFFPPKDLRHIRDGTEYMNQKESFSFEIFFLIRILLD